MPLSSPTFRRALTHTRAIQIEAFARDDGLWNFGAKITPTKLSDTQLASGIRAPGASAHLRLDLTVNTRCDVIEVEAALDEVSHRGHFNTVASDYRQVSGLNSAKCVRVDVGSDLLGTHDCRTKIAQSILPAESICLLPKSSLRAKAHPPAYKAKDHFKSTVVTHCDPIVARLSGNTRVGPSRHLWQYPNPVSFNQVCFIQ